MARFDLGLPEEEIGHLNLMEYDALIRRKTADDNRSRLNFGIVAATIINSAPFGDPDRKAVSPLEFVPDWAPKKATNDLTEMSPEDQKWYLISMFSKKTENRR